MQSCLIYVCFTTNLSQLSKEKTLIPSQFPSILLSLFILGLLFEIGEDQILFFIKRMNPNLGILLQLFFNLKNNITNHIYYFITLSHIFYCNYSGCLYKLLQLYKLESKLID